MCGIVGYKPLEENAEAGPAFKRLFDECSIRGLHAFGASQPGVTFRSFKQDEVYGRLSSNVVTIAHTRYCQSGDWRVLENNQPIVVGDMALAMNGVIHMGTKEEFEKAFGVLCEADNDSEVFLRCLEAGEDAAHFIDRITGSFAAVWLVGDRLYAGHNWRRPLWRCRAYGGLWYTNTRDIFLRAGFPEPEPVPVGVEAA